MAFIAGRIHADGAERLAFNRSYAPPPIIITTAAIKIITPLIASQSPFGIDVQSQ